MTKTLPIILTAALLALPGTAPAQVTTELDAFWADMSRTVEEGDFEGYGALYHPDAVLVMLTSGSVPIGSALAGWKQLFVDTHEGRAEASVEFRFTSRLNDATTAHETGIFRYSFKPADGEEQVAPVHFESLLVKKDGNWLMVMEYQKSQATEEEWAAAG